MTIAVLKDNKFTTIRYEDRELTQEIYDAHSTAPYSLTLLETDAPNNGPDDVPVFRDPTATELGANLITSGDLPAFIT